MISTLLITASVVSPPAPAGAGVYFNDLEYTYKEYWASHASFTASCSKAVVGNSWYVEPEGGCAKTISLNIPDDIQSAWAAVIYVDFWRNRATKSARFTINNGPIIRPLLGDDFSRSPYVTTVPLNQFKQGVNLLEFQEATGPYHVHDVMVRVYHSPTKPIVPGPGSDVTPPGGSLRSIIAGGVTRTPAQGGVLNVDDNKITLTADATDAAYVEFHGYYDGYDEDNDGKTLDWHSFLRNNWGPGGTAAKPTGATIGHIGTDATAPYQATWDLAAVESQPGVKFKIRVVDAAGNVREAPGGVSSEFTLSRSYGVEAYSITDFVDAPLFFNGMFPQQVARTIDLPNDLSGVQRAIMLGNYWENPAISLNDRPSFRAFRSGEDSWTTSRRELDVGLLRPGSNLIRWAYVPPGFGAMVEKPGPMIVIHRTAPTGRPSITTQPVSAVVTEGRGTQFTATATGAPTLQFQWHRNGTPIPGATNPTYTTPALSPADSGSSYTVVVTNASGSATSAAATVTVLPTGAPTGSWWNSRWDFRVPVTVSAGAVARKDKIAEVSLNFTELMRSAGSGLGAFSPSSVRVVEVNGSGQVVDVDVPVQVDTATLYDASRNATATVVWLMKGTTAAYGTRSYHIYFDKASKGIPAAAAAPLVTVTDGVTDLGFASYRFNAQGHTWVYHKDGGGFSKLLDADGRDWIAWNSQTGSNGDFRGVPNAVKPPAGYFHPGRLGLVTSRIVSTGPLKITIESTTADGLWRARWEVYPTHATFSMPQAASQFWFLYEGTPGGAVEVGNDVIVRSDGLETPINGTFESDIAGQEWAYVADKALGRSIYFAHHQDDGAVDSYRLLDGKMPILGFGRGGTSLNSPYLDRTENGEPQRFTVGLTNATDFATTGAAVRAAYQDLDRTIGSVEFSGVFVGPRSDDFSGLSLRPDWTLVDPLRDSVVSHSGTELQLAVAGIGTHDLWTGRNNAPRLLQSVADGDMSVEVAFTSKPTKRYTGQGLIFQTDNNNLIRFSVEHDGTSPRLVTSVMENGQARHLVTRVLSGAPPNFLRVTRVGDSWTLDRSFDGKAWTTTPAVTHRLAVRQAGLFALSHGSPNGPAFTASVDYLQNLAEPRLADDAPKISGVSVEASGHSAVVSWDTDRPSVTVLQHGASANVGKRTEQSQLTTSHRVLLDFLECGAPYFVQPEAIADGVTAKAPITTFTTKPCGPLFSDDFSSPTLDPRWLVHDPVGDTVATRSGTNMLLSVPRGSDHNLYANVNRAPRLRQDGPIGDFSAEVKFESVLTARFQMQGIVVEESADTFARFEIHHDGTGPKAYVAAVAGNVGQQLLAGVPLPAGPSHYLRVTRTGNDWTLRHSTNGTTWTAIGTFNFGMRSLYVGPYIGNTATAPNTPPAFVGSIDYFFNTDAVIANEDAGAGPDTVPPAIGNVVVTPGSPHAQAVSFAWTTDEPATTRVDWGTTTSYTGTSFIDNTALLTHAATLSPLNCGQTYQYRLRSNDAAGNIGTTANKSFTMPACPPVVRSDDFSGSSLHSSWLVVDPAGDGSVSQTGGLLHLRVPGGSKHDVSATNNRPLRLVQPVPDSDFEVEAKFESVVNFSGQMQGLLFEASEGNLIRFDLSSTGTETRAFVGRLRPGSLTTLAYVPVNGATAGTLRVKRVGGTWTFSHSTDGTTFSTVYTGDLAFSVARVGPFAGNAGAVLSAIPSHTAVVDYFFDTAAPIVPEDGGQDGGPQIEVVGGPTLKFGTPGLAQPDLNVIGRVTDPDGVASMTFRVNGGDAVAMGVGPDGRRLVVPGEFNATIPAAALNPGLNTVTLRALDLLSHEAVTTLTIDWTPGLTWPLPYSVDWATAKDVPSVAQIVDGRWKIEGDTVRNTDIGYDRLLAFGDASWSSFEATVPVTINSIDPSGYLGNSGGPGVGFIPHWMGHVDAGEMQPRWGFAGRLGALAWYRYKQDTNGDRFEIRDSNAALVAEDLTGKKLTRGVTYVFKLRVETGQGVGPRYQLKAWPLGQLEPAKWDLTTQLPPGSPDRGSLLLVAHHVDASFGDLTVTKLTTGKPTIAPNGGSFTGTTKVQLATTTSGGQIRYTTDGSEPTEASPLYTEPFLLQRTATVRARTFQTGFETGPETAASFTVAAPPARVATGLRALYTFDDGGGSIVRDSSGVGTPAHLAIESGSVEWLPQGALRVSSASVIRSAGGVSKVNSAIATSGAYTVEAWVDPAANTGRASIMGLGSATTAERNAAVTQDGTTYRVPLRAVGTDTSGNPAQAALGAVRPELHHVVVTRDSLGALRVYVDGVSVHSATRSGAFTNWNNAYRMALAGLPNGGEAWTGDLYLVAVYSSMLTATQVTQNFRAGPTPPPINTAPIVDAGPALTTVAGAPTLLDATVLDDGWPKPPGATTAAWLKVSGPGTVAFSAADAVDTTATFSVAGDYVVRLTAADGALTTSATRAVKVVAATATASAPVATQALGGDSGLGSVATTSGVTGGVTLDETSLGSSDAGTSPSVTVPSVMGPDRVRDGIVALYDFNDGGGATISDRSGFGTPLDLTVDDPGRTTWVSSGLRVDRPVVVTSAGAGKVNDALMASGAVTMEAWITPSNTSQGAPATIVNISTGSSARNMALGQAGSDYVNHLRTTKTDANGEPATVTAGVAAKRQHVVYTRDALGVVRTYVDGVPRASTTSAGTLSSWVSTSRLSLGAELDGTKPWSGTFHLVAIYNRALTADEVARNFTAGDV